MIARIMEISLTPELETQLKLKVESGLYASISDVVRESLRLLTERDVLRMELKHGIEQLERREGIEFGSEQDFLSAIKGQ